MSGRVRRLPLLVPRVRLRVMRGCQRYFIFAICLGPRTVDFGRPPSGIVSSIARNRYARRHLGGAVH